MNQWLNGLDDLFERFEPGSVVIEASIPQGDNAHYTARKTLGLHAIAEMVCFQNDMTLANGRLAFHTVDRVRSQVCGRARLTSLERAIRPKVTVKEMIVDPWLSKMGWLGISDDHNTKDSLVLWHYGVSLKARQGYRP